MPKSIEDHCKAVLKGKRNKFAGQYWERIIEASCQYYRTVEAAEIQKTPEPLRPIKSIGEGRFIAYYEKMAQPDYKGTIRGGRAIVFEAKHTDTDRLQRNVISIEQEKQLNMHLKLGAECFVMISFGFEKFFKVPWAVFRDMKKKYGRKYVTADDIKEYEVKYIGGKLLFLE